LKTQVQKGDIGLAVRIPKEFANDLVLDEGSTVELALQNGWPVLRQTVSPKYELSRLLSRVTEDSCYGGYDFGDPSGSDQW
jgi:antitoxin component of MazEF toxin-antitoxin module